ncbi:DUF5684 domain-containing protein [Fusobacterium sp. PH5-44]|uniref:DUF5684 domain-containing protein n=1 Tax=unclassified Fusobacterium TaxID=2648384 RepID=UPI003D20B968
MEWLVMILFAYFFIGTLGKIILYIITNIGLYGIFQKAGVSGILAFIPGYNLYIYVTKIARRHWLYFVFMVFPFIISGILSSVIPQYLPLDSVKISEIIMFVFCGVVSYDVAKNYGKNWMFAMGLCFFPFIFTLILGFGKSKFSPKKNYDFAAKILGSKNKDDNDRYFDGK